MLTKLISSSNTPNIFNTKCCSNVRRAKFLKKISGDSNALKAEYSCARYLVAVDENLLVVPLTSRSSTSMSLRFFSMNELQGFLSHSSLAIDLQNSILLDIEDASTQPLRIVMGYPLKISDFGENILEKNWRDKIGPALGGELVSARSAMLHVQQQNERNLVARMLSLKKWNDTYKYCPQCTNVLLKSLTKDAASCSKCKKTFFSSVYPVAICLVHNRENTHALLVRHIRNPRCVYTAISGFAQIGETLAETVHREIAEEVGIDCEEVKNLNITQSWPFPDGSLMCGFHAIAEKSSKLEICLEELLDAQWFSREEITKAYENIINDPLMEKGLSSNKSAPNFHYIPPNATIAHQIIKAWLSDNFNSLK